MTGIGIPNVGKPQNPKLENESNLQTQRPDVDAEAAVTRLRICRLILIESIFAPSVDRDKQVVRCFRRICFPDKLQYNVTDFVRNSRRFFRLDRISGPAACLPGNRGCDVYEFLAIGPGIKQTWRRRLPSQEVIRLGRAPQNGWAVPWDMRISREHADLVLEGGDCGFVA